MSRLAVLVGLGPQGLFLLRALCEAGYEVHALDFRKTPAFYSRYGRKYLVADHMELRARLQDLSRQSQGRARCDISSGAMLETVLTAIPETYEWFDVFPRPREAVWRLRDKRSTYALARELGITVPETHSLTDSQAVRGMLVGGSRLIAKWRHESSDREPRAFKTRVISGVAEYDALLAFVPSDQRESVLVQRLLGGPRGLNVSHLGYYVAGECVAEYLAHQVRQYPPGITSFVQEYTGTGADRLRCQAKSLFAATQYTGFGEAEFMLEGDPSEPYLLEVNPRTCGWSSALLGRYRDLTPLFDEEKPRPLAVRSPRRATWCNWPRDVRALVAQCREARSPAPAIAGLLSQLRVRTYDVMDRRDPAPFIMQLVRRMHW